MKIMEGRKDGGMKEGARKEMCCFAASGREEVRKEKY